MPPASAHDGEAMGDGRSDRVVVAHEVLDPFFEEAAGHAGDAGDARRQRTAAHPGQSGGVDFDRLRAGHEFIARLLARAAECALREPDERMKPEGGDEERFEQATEVVAAQHMRRFVRDQRWPIPYLFDETQDVARALGAERTPHVFVLDAEQRLAYRGAPDADHRDAAQGAAWLREALDAVLAGERPRVSETEARGCSVKWRA